MELILYIMFESKKGDSQLTFEVCNWAIQQLRLHYLWLTKENSIGLNYLFD